MGQDGRKVTLSAAGLSLKILYFYRTQVNLGPIFGSGCLSLSTTPCVDLPDVTLVDEDTNSILTGNANWAIQGNVAMQV